MLTFDDAAAVDSFNIDLSFIIINKMKLLTADNGGGGGGAALMLVVALEASVG